MNILLRQFHAELREEMQLAPRDLNPSFCAGTISKGHCPISAIVGRIEVALIRNDNLMLAGNAFPF
jgi:hypothetical protein